MKQRVNKRTGASKRTKASDLPLKKVKQAKGGTMISGHSLSSSGDRPVESISLN